MLSQKTIQSAQVEGQKACPEHKKSCKYNLSIYRNWSEILGSSSEAWIYIYSECSHRSIWWWHLVSQASAIKFPLVRILKPARVLCPLWADCWRVFILNKDGAWALLDFTRTSCLCSISLITGGITLLWVNLSLEGTIVREKAASTRTRHRGSQTVQTCFLLSRHFLYY